MSEIYSNVTNECPVCVKTFSKLTRGFCDECYGETLDYGTKWKDERYGIIFIRDPLYCLSILAMQWKETDESKKFRKWLIDIEKLHSLHLECSEDVLTSGKMKDRTFFDVSSNEDSYCHYIRNNTIKNKNLADFKSYLFLVNFLEMMSML